ncbi:MAG: 4-alpha-glucanotransferase [Eubacteriales bacterium]|nr:4-alpha-glucanotransferase [Eubacteriales bacterium]
MDKNTKASGILLPVFSLRSKYGRGRFSREAYEFIDWLAGAGQSYWQILPLNPAGTALSPYMPTSCFAGDPAFLDPETLYQKGVLSREDLDDLAEFHDPRHFQYVLKQAFLRDKTGFEAKIAGASCDSAKQTRQPSHLGSTASSKGAYAGHGCSDRMENFELLNKDRLDDHALFSALSEHFGTPEWLTWPEEIRLRKPEAIAAWGEQLADDVRFHKILQLEFSSEWKKIRDYAHSKGIKIIGDMPFYPGRDGCDLWAHRDLFKTRPDGSLDKVSGCPPDAFAAEGQLWGTPVYDWEKMKKDRYAWWIRRLQRNLDYYDVIRLDHTRGFEAYYEIPAGAPTALEGEWQKGPGTGLFNEIRAQLGDVSLIAEDLGYITEDVHQMIRDAGLPGMKVLQFAFDSDWTNPHLPINFNGPAVVYTGTHDNDTALGWYREAPAWKKKFLTFYIRKELKGRLIPALGIGSPENGSDDGYDEGEPAGPVMAEPKAALALIEAAMASGAGLAVVPIQDYLGLGSEARVNTPGTIKGNWTWQMPQGTLTRELCGDIMKITEHFGRLNKK